MVSFDLAEGNPGCLQFMMESYTECSMSEVLKIEEAFQRMQDAGIKGSKLYMLWNDCCGRDTSKTVKHMLEDPIEDIIKHINYERGRGIKYE